MLSPDLAARMQTAGSTQLQPLALDKQVADKLSDFSPGQRLTAQIQAFLPNGTYRATIAQRDITLALPFSAKSGDTLELEVVESDGKLTLALLARQQSGGEKGGGTEAASTTLSRTGQLIASLFGRARGEGRGNAAALPLNGNQPIAGSPPQSAQDILPLLRQAITQSGMFYESHQAGWVAGRFEKAALMQEPQGRLSPSLQQQQPGKTGAEAGQPARPTTAPPMPAAGTAVNDMEGRQAQAPHAGAGAQLVAREAMPIVQQQLESLANQQFNWQGQVWPGQQIRWEIEEDGRSRQEDDETSPGWQTRLYLALPQLGELEARIRLAGNQIHLDLDAADAATRERLHAAIGDLRKQLDDAGLALGNVGIHVLAEAAADAPQTHVAAET